MSMSTVLVSGIPRSGTSMLMRMLDAGGIGLYVDAVRRADEFNPHGYFEHDCVRNIAQSNDFLHDVGDRAVKIVAPLVTHVPPDFAGKMLYVLRDTNAVMRSQLRMLRGRGQFAADPENTLALVSEMLRRTDDYLNRCWKTRMLTLKYEEVTGEPIGEARRIADFLDRDLDIESMAAAVDAW